MWFYRLVLTLLSPVLVGWLLWRRLTGADPNAVTAERFGGGPGSAPGAIWLHGASNGEIASARRLIERLRARGPVLVTANTPTAREMVAGWGLDGVAARAAPLDWAPLVARFLRLHRPRALIVLENDLWPERIASARARGMPVLYASARMSARSARGWGRVPGLARQVLGGIGHLAPQDRASADRFAALGLAADRIGPVLNLKVSAGLSDAALPAFATRWPRAATLLAASTHPGEEQVVLSAFARALASRPDLRLILAPRHPRRSAELRALIDAAGLPFATRSRGEDAGPETRVYLADTMGEMPLWYRMAGATFVGGSLVDKGGHTPFEPEAFGSAILHGPNLRNFAEAYAALDAAGAARAVSDADSLAAGFLDLADGTVQADMARRASAALAPLRENDAAYDAFLAALDRLLAGQSSG